MTAANREAATLLTEESLMPESAEQRKALRAEMDSMIGRLVAEFAHAQPAGTVVRCVARCREQLLVSGVRNGLVPATEAAARAVLNRATPVHAGP